MIGNGRTYLNANLRQGLIPARLAVFTGILNSDGDPMLIAWTTLPDAASAQALAKAVIEKHLAVCIQVEGPVTSLYRWDGRTEIASEYRLMIKLLENQSASLEAYIKTHHPYSTPEWIAVRAEHVGEKYLSWAVAVSTSSTL